MRKHCEGCDDRHEGVEEYIVRTTSGSFRADYCPACRDFAEHENDDVLTIMPMRPEQTIRLADTDNMLRRIASAEIAVKGEYFCMVDGKRTRHRRRPRCSRAWPGRTSTRSCTSR